LKFHHFKPFSASRGMKKGILKPNLAPRIIRFSRNPTNPANANYSHLHHSPGIASTCEFLASGDPAQEQLHHSPQLHRNNRRPLE
jgi:hypothetical protein